MDFTQDRNRSHLTSLLTKVGGVSGIESAEDVLPGFDPKSIPSASFADSRRRWPMHTKAATVASACYMADAPTEASERDVETLYKQASVWGVLPEVERIFLNLGTHNELTKQASTAIEFALDEMYGTQHVQRFPVDTAELVKISTDRFILDRAKYPYAWRQKVAEALRERIVHHKIATWFDADQKSYIDKAAGFAVGSTDKLWHELAERQVHGKWSTSLPKLAEVVETIAEASDGVISPELTKLACQAFSTFDADAGLNEFTDLAEIALIDDSGTLTKIAAERQFFVKLADGTTVDVRSIPKEALTAVSPKLASMPQSELLAVLPTLPANMAESLTQVI